MELRPGNIAGQQLFEFFLQILGLFAEFGDGKTTNFQFLIEAGREGEESFSFFSALTAHTPLVHSSQPLCAINKTVSCSKGLSLPTVVPVFTISVSELKFTREAF